MHNYLIYYLFIYRITSLHKGAIYYIEIYIEYLF